MRAVVPLLASAGGHRSSIAAQAQDLRTSSDPSDGIGLAAHIGMPNARQSLEQWVRRGRDPLATTIRRAATSAIGTYGAYVVHGLRHAGLRRPFRGLEAIEPLAGDGCVAEPQSIKTFVTDIAAPPDAVWPYLIQMGYGRAGWYGWYPFENGGRGSAEKLLDELQGLAVDDHIPDGPRAAEGLGIWRVITLDRPHAMVLFSRRVATTGREIAADEHVDEPTIECSWAFVLRPHGVGTRLIVRVRARFLGMNGGTVGALARRLFDTGDTVMEWTMLAGIKTRAEHRDP
jgi:proline iminopeptidase